MNDAATTLGTTQGMILLAIFSVGWIALGLYWGRKAKSLDGFMVAGRNVGLALGTATAVATWVTSNTIMLAPQFALQLGIWGMLGYATASFGLFLFAPLAKRIRQVMPEGYTSVEFIRLRYGTVASVLFLAISLFYGLTWMVSMGIAAGLLLQSLAGIPYIYGMTIIMTVCVIYTLFGGLYAVIGTDFIQSTIIILGVVAVAIAVITQVPLDTVHANLTERRPELLNVFVPMAIMAFFNNLFFGIGEIFHSNVWWSRAFAMREGTGTKAYVLAGLLWLPIPIVAGFLGLAAPALDINVFRPDVAGPVVASEVLGSVGAVLVFIVAFCSLASSVDSLLAATSDVVTTEVLRPLLFRDATDRTLRRVAGCSIIGIGLLTWLICLPWNSIPVWLDATSADDPRSDFFTTVITNGEPIGTLATVLFFAGPLVGSAIWPIVTGLFLRRPTATGAIAAMTLGSAAGITAYFTIGWYSASLIGAGVSFIVTAMDLAFSSNHFQWSRLSNASTEEART